MKSENYSILSYSRSLEEKLQDGKGSEVYLDSILLPKLVSRCFFHNIVEYKGQFYPLDRKGGDIRLEDRRLESLDSFSDLSSAKHYLIQNYVSRFFFKEFILSRLVRSKQIDLTGNDSQFIALKFLNRFVLYKKGFWVVKKIKSGRFKTIFKHNRFMLAYFAIFFPYLMNALLYVKKHAYPLLKSGLQFTLIKVKENKNLEDSELMRELIRFIDSESNYKESSQILKEKSIAAKFSAHSEIEKLMNLGMVESVITYLRSGINIDDDKIKLKILKFFIKIRQIQIRYKDFYNQTRISDPGAIGYGYDNSSIFLLIDRVLISQLFYKWVNNSHKDILPWLSLLFSAYAGQAEKIISDDEFKSFCSKNPDFLELSYYFGLISTESLLMTESPILYGYKLVEYEEVKNLTKGLLLHGSDTSFTKSYKYNSVYKNSIKELEVSVVERSASLYQLRDVYKIDKMSTLLTDDGKLIIESFQELPGTFAYKENFPDFKFINNEKVVIKNRRDVFEVKSPVIFPIIGGAENYYTFCIEILPRILFADGALKDKTIPILVSQKVNGWQRGLMKMVGIDERRIIVWDALRDYKLRDCYYPITSFFEIPDLATIESLKNKLLSNFSNSDLDGGGLPNKIYISRSFIGHHRSLINEDEIKRALVEMGFTVVYPERQSLVDQIKIFSNAEVIIGPTGAWCSNLIYCKPRARIFVMGPLDHQGKFFQHLSSINDLVYTSIVGKSVPSLINDRPHWNYFVSLSDIQRGVSQ